MEDTIIEELHKYREEWAARFNYDIHALVADLRRSREAENRSVVTLAPKRLAPEQQGAKTMTITLDLSDETYRQLARRAQAQCLPIAEVIAQALEEAAAARNKAFWERMETEDVIAKQEPAPPTDAEQFQPIQVQGKPLSEVIIEERR